MNFLIYWISATIILQVVPALYRYLKSRRTARPTPKGNYAGNYAEREENLLRERQNAAGNKANRSLEKRLRTQRVNTRPGLKTRNTPSSTFFMIAGGSALLLGGLSLGFVGLEAILQKKSIISNQKSSSYQPPATSSEKHRWQPPETARIPEKIDPAVEIKPFITTYSDQRFPSLNDMDQYRKGTGDLARVQERMLRSRDKSRQYPHIIIGNGEFTGHCSMQGPTIGAYRLDCKTIQINFTDGNTYYEYPIEILATLAHEYAHHLVNITIGANAMSGLENELVADCFAGLMIGYWDKYSKVSEQEIRASAEMMIQISKQEGLNFVDNHGDPGQRLGAFLGGALRAAGEPSPQYENFCRSLDRIIDWDNGLP